MEHSEFTKSKVFSVGDALEYVPNSIATQVIARTRTGHVQAMAFDANKLLNSKSIPFDTIIQIVEGKAEIVIDNNSHVLEIGQSIIIPAHSRNVIKALGRFKMQSTIIKNGYEESFTLESTVRKQYVSTEPPIL